MRHELATPARPGNSPAGPVVAEAMIRFPKLCATDTTVARARGYLLDDHVHALLVVENGLLVSVVERDDLVGAPDDDPAWRFGRCSGRVVSGDDDLAAVTAEMALQGRRRVAVVDGDRLLGLLCRKRSGRGFCSDDGVAARAAEHRGP